VGPCTTQGLSRSSRSRHPRGLTPVMFELAQNFPNPANPTTRIEFRVAHSGMARLDLFDVIGRHVNTLFEGAQIPGGTTAWSLAAGTLPPGCTSMR